jgi:hypothetical protein
MKKLYSLKTFAKRASFTFLKTQKLRKNHIFRRKSALSKQLTFFKLLSFTTERIVKKYILNA